LYTRIFCRAGYSCCKAGADYVSPFIGRIDDSGWDGVQLIEQIAKIYAIQGFETEILAASIEARSIL
jgi:transaldolase